MQAHQQLTYIQGIRGIAILLIVLFHFLPGVCPNGYMGVDVFFIISGYFLLGKQVRGEQDFRLLPFLMQKGQRLLFPYFVLIFLVAVAAVLILPAGDMMKAGQLLKACLLGKGNVFLDHLSGNYFSSDTRALPLMHLWYMGVMLQSLLLFAGLFTFWQLFHVSSKVRMLHLAVVGVVSFTLAFLYLLPLPFEYSQNTYYWTSARLWEFALGGLLYGHHRFGSSACAPLLSASAFVIIITCSFIPLPNSAVGVMLGALCGILLLLFGKSCRSFIPLENKFFVGMGNISFSLYLIHWPCICYAEYILGRPISCYDTVWFGLIILAAAYLFHRGIEKPRYSFTLLPLSAILACATYRSISMTNGFAAYLHQDANHLLACSTSHCNLPNLPEHSPLWEGSSGIAPNQFSPRVAPAPLLQELGDTDEGVSFIIMGDSHASDLAVGMHLQGLENKWHGLYLNSYVIPFWGAEYRSPASVAPGNFFDEDKANHILCWLKQHPSIKTVLIAQYWSWRLCPHTMWNGQAIDENITRARVSELRQFCRHIKDCGKNVVLVTDTPQLPASSPLRLLGSHIMWHQGKPVPSALCCNRIHYDELNGDFNKEMDKMEHDGLCRVLHRENVFFRTDRFVAYDGNHLTHRDSHHLYPYGSAFSLSGNIDEIRKLLSEE